MQGKVWLPSSPNLTLAEQPCFLRTITMTTTLSHGEPWPLIKTDTDRKQERSQELAKPSTKSKSSFSLSTQRCHVPKQSTAPESHKRWLSKCSLFPQAHIYCTNSSNRRELIARCIMLQDLTLEKLHFPMNGSWSLVSRKLPFHKLKKRKSKDS